MVQGKKLLEEVVDLVLHDPGIGLHSRGGLVIQAPAS